MVVGAMGMEEKTDGRAGDANNVVGYAAPRCSSTERLERGVV